MRNGVMLGRSGVDHVTPRPRFASYAKVTLPTPPVSVDWTKGTTEFGMMLNDTLGDCTIAGCGHALQIITLNAGTMQTEPDSVILQYYELWDGYNPADPSTDQGGIELNVLNQWKANTFAFHKLDAFVDPNVADMNEVFSAISLCGGLYIGMEVPNSVFPASGPPDPSVVWDVVADDGGIDGGHCVFVTGYDQSTGVISFISWGQVFKMTLAFWQKYVDEAHALILADWFNVSGIDPTGLDVAQLIADSNSF